MPANALTKSAIVPAGPATYTRAPPASNVWSAERIASTDPWIGLVPSASVENDLVRVEVDERQGRLAVLRGDDDDRTGSEEVARPSRAPPP